MTQQPTQMTTQETPDAQTPRAARTRPAMRLRELDIDAWEEALFESGVGVFQTTPALRTLDRHTTGTLRLFGGFVDDQPLVLQPLVTVETPIGAISLSPPPGYGIRRLGPVVDSQRAQAADIHTFTELLLDRLDGIGPRYLFMTCDSAYTDPRPYQRPGFNVTPLFTYRISLADRSADDVLGSFSKSLRREIRNSRESELSIRQGGIAEAKQIYETVETRFAEQGLSLPLSWPFMRDLIAELQGRARVYVAESPDGTFHGGISVLYGSDTAYFWKGGTRSSYEGHSVNSLLHWRIITDCLTDPELDGIDSYDLYTANNERLARYKSKFGGRVVPYYRIESTGLLLRLAKTAYRAYNMRSPLTQINDRLRR